MIVLDQHQSLAFQISLAAHPFHWRKQQESEFADLVRSFVRASLPVAIECPIVDRFAEM